MFVPVSRGKTSGPAAVSAGLAAVFLVLGAPALAESTPTRPNRTSAPSAGAAPVLTPPEGTYVRKDGGTTVIVEPPDASQGSSALPPPAGASGEPNGQNTAQSTPLETLRSLTAEAGSIQLSSTSDSGQPDIPAIRRRLERLDAIRGTAQTAAQASMKSGNLSHRLEAFLLTGSAHETFADALERLSDPPGLDEEASAAWAIQKKLYLHAARTRALAYFRACAALSSAPRGRSATSASAPASPETARTCTAALRRMQGKSGVFPQNSSLDRLPTDPARIVSLRSHELTICVSEAAARTRDAMPDNVLLRLDIGSLGEVSGASVEGTAGSEGLKACLAEAVKLWVFPTIPGAVLELPVNLKVMSE